MLRTIKGRDGDGAAAEADHLPNLSGYEFRTSLGVLRVISPEGLIGFKLQGCQRLTQDIRALLRANRRTIDLAEVRQYFQLFNKESLLDEILSQLN